MAEEAEDGFINAQSSWALLTARKRKRKGQCGAPGDPAAASGLCSGEIAQAWLGAPRTRLGFRSRPTRLLAPARQSQLRAAGCHLSVLVTTCFHLVRRYLREEPLETTSSRLRGPRTGGKGRASARSRPPRLCVGRGKRIRARTDFQDVFLNFLG